MSVIPETGKVSSILVPLDVLLDTRIGTLAKMGGPELVLQVLQNDYHHRKDDRFPNVDHTAFTLAYALRDEETLKLSHLTNIIDAVLRNLVHTLIKQAYARPFHQGVRVVVNTYPYQLASEVNQQIVEAVIEKLVGDLEDVLPLTVVAEYLPDEALTPEYCKQHFAALFMYDYTHWLDVQQVALKQRPMPEVTLFAPALYFVQTPTEDELKQFASEFNWHPFEVIQRSLRGGLDLQLLPIEQFSLIKPAA